MLIAYVITSPAVNEDHGEIEYIYLNSDWARHKLQYLRARNPSYRWEMESIVVEEKDPGCPQTVIFGQIEYPCKETGEHNRHIFMDGQIKWTHLSTEDAE